MTYYISAGRFMVALVLALLIWTEVGVGHAEGGQVLQVREPDERATHLASRGDPGSVRRYAVLPEVLSVRSQYLPPTATPVPTATALPSPTPIPTPTATPEPELFLKYMGIFRVTAYSDSPLNGTDGLGITRSGQRTRWGAVAVDPRVIPLHSRLMIEGMGDMVFDALDTGGGIKGNWVDIWFRTDDEALLYGVQYRSVFVVVDGPR
jgi:3D (Asp-Asp-Asp) domain-containing protein